jgi:dTDP-4-amino-4,6-dideoxygalactose transaminase
MKVPFLDLHAQYDPIIDDIREAIEQVIQTHQYIMGPQVEQLEAAIADYCGCRYAVGCSSGTDALLLALSAHDIGKGDEVITTSFTFFATASTIYRVGAKPVFVDIDPRTFNISPAEIEKAITPKTKAIIAVHLFGQPADMDSIMKIAKKHDLIVIEDNAQGIGAKYGDKYAGTIGDVGTLSFFPAKNLGAMGDAGMCLTNNEELAGKLKLLRVHGENPKYYHNWVGFNSRLDTLQAAILLVKLKHLDRWNKMRQENAAYYNEHLADIEEIELPYVKPGITPIYNQYTLLAEDRDALLEYLRAKDIGCAVYYPQPLHLQPCFALLNYKAGDLPVCEEISARVISIPIYSELSQAQLDYVIAEIRSFYQKERT